MQFSDLQGDFDPYFNNNFEDICDVLDLNSNLELGQECITSNMQNLSSIQEQNNKNQQKQQNLGQLENQKNNQKNFVSVKNERTKYNQKLYRKRQKDKLSNMEQQIQELTQKYEELAKEQQALQARNNILEEMLDLRTQRLSKLQDSEKSDNSLYVMFNAPFQNEFFNLNKNMQTIIKTQITFPFQSEFFQRSFSIQDFRDLSFDDIVAYHGGYVSLFSTHLNTIKHNEKQSKRNLQIVWRELMGFVLRIILTNPRLIRRWGGYNPHAAPPTFSFWTQIVQQLGLTEQQMRKMVQLRCILYEKFVKIQQNIKKCCAKMEKFDLQNFCEVVASQQYMQRNCAFQEMTQIIQSLEVSVMRFSMVIRMRVFTFLQSIRFVVSVYPQGPDFIALTHCIFQLLRQKQNPGQEIPQDDQKLRNMDVEKRLMLEVQQMRKFLGLQYNFNV